MSERLTGSMGIVGTLIERYQSTAEKRFKAGKRPYMLQCEISQGEHCSVRFEQISQDEGIAKGVRDLVARCPGHAITATRAIVYSAAAAVLPIVALSATPCDTPCDDAFGC